MMQTTTRPVSWKWYVTGLLLFATMINYMDRQTLANLAVRITSEFDLSQEQYGNLEFAFGWAFAAGSLAFGFLADRFSVGWLYPAVLLAWSLAGLLTGYVRTYDELLVCRTLLGFFESGHWPCAMITTQRLLSRADRTLGNSVLQSGASIGAIVTPLIILFICNRTGSGTWREPFLIIGAVGLLWIVGWFLLVRPTDLKVQAREGEAPAEPVELTREEPRPPGRLMQDLGAIVRDRRFFVLLVMVIAINTTWQLVRAWLPSFLQKGRNYPEAEALLFNSAYYVATDVGCIIAGAATLALARRGMAIHTSRVLVYGSCALLTALTVVVATLPAGWALLGVLLLVAAGSLGLFPCYYSFSQELSEKHQGKVTGLLAACGWAVTSPFQKLFGRQIDQTGSYDLGIALAGLAPLMAFLVLLGLWNRQLGVRNDES